MSDFQFTLADLVSNNTSNTNSNPFYREYMKGKTGPPTTSAAFSTTAKGGSSSYDAYAGTSVLSLSDVMMNTPLQNNPNQTLGTQGSLVDTLLQGALGKVGGALGMFDALIPTDSTITSAISSSKAKTNPQTDPSNTYGINNTNNPSSSSSPTSGTAPGGLPAGMKVPPSQGVPVANFVNLALQQVGKQYIWGAAGPNAFDCSGLVMWCLQQLGVVFASVHFTGAQYDFIKQAGLDCDPSEAINVYGALLFVGNSSGPAGEHVAISLGDGKQVVEALNPSYGVIKDGFEPTGQWTAAGFIPGLDYSKITYGQGMSSLPLNPGVSRNNLKNLGA